ELQDSAADRRRHHVTRAYRDQDRTQLRNRLRVGEGCLARGRCSAITGQQGIGGRLSRQGSRRVRGGARTPPESRARQTAGITEGRARQWREVRLGNLYAAGAEEARHHDLRRYPADGTVAGDRLDPVLPGVGTAWPLS